MPINPQTGTVVEGVEAQTRQVLDNLKAIAEAAGTGLDRVIKATIYLTDMDDFGLVNEIYASYFSEPYPARATIGISALAVGALVEIEAVAEID